jgi:regulation of enolase protein 1 (concanavalin A-like superfamily)
MKIPRYLLPLALLTACTPDSASTTANEAATTTSAAAAKNAAPIAVPGEPCNVLIGNLTLTRSLNGAAQHATVDKGVLTLRAEAKSDNFDDPDGKLSNNSAPVLLTQVDNTKPFTLTARVAPQFLDTYDAGVLYVYLRPGWWQKFCFERDERARTRVVSVRTIGTSDDNDHDLITAKQVYLKISSDAKTIGFYHSLDGKQWELARLYKNDYPAAIWLGLSTQSPVGNGMSSRFDSCTLTQKSVADFRLGK